MAEAFVSDERRPTTTRSPALSPERISQRALSSSPTSTARRETLPSASTTSTERLPSASGAESAAVGIVTTPLASPSTIRTWAVM